MRTPELGWHVQASRLNNESARFEGRIRVGMEDRFLEISIRPMLDEPGQRTGTYVCCDDVSAQDKLQTTVAELESTGEELQSANEELETINEELQSTNEELESTNEELKSLNDELEVRGQDLDQINDVYLRTLEKIRLPVMLVMRICASSSGIPWPFASSASDASPRSRCTGSNSRCRRPSDACSSGATVACFQSSGPSSCKIRRWEGNCAPVSIFT